MILKTKRLQNTKTPQTVAGQKQEQNVAFFLRRAYKDHKQVLVINDFKFTNTNQYKDLIAQREFSGPEARQRVKSIVILRLSSLTQHQNR